MKLVPHVSYYLSFLLVFLGIVCLAFVRYNSPDNMLLGKWKEVSWEYEKTDEASRTDDRLISPEEKRTLSSGLIIHESEIWEFGDGGKLQLIKSDNQTEELSWRLKGRGHVLKLLHSEDKPEYYQIYELTSRSMEIHFYNELQVRGIVKMKFERI